MRLFVVPLPGPFVKRFGSTGTCHRRRCSWHVVSNGFCIYSAVSQRRPAQKLSSYCGAFGIIGIMWFMVMACVQDKSEDPLRNPRWIAPMEGQLKANVDADWDELSKMAGLGIIIRNHMGQVILSEWRHIYPCASAEEAGLQACVAGIKYILSIRTGQAIVESDCLRVFRTMSSSK